MRFENSSHADARRAVERGSSAKEEASGVAYFNLLASVPEPDVEQLRRDASAYARPSLVLGASHLLASWVQVQPLGGLLRRALDGGEPTHPALWHPLRPPLVHRPAAVRELARQLDAAWEEARGQGPPPDDDWLAVEVGRLLRLFRNTHNTRHRLSRLATAPARCPYYPWRRF
jgi:hypothetical protein